MMVDATSMIRWIVVFLMVFVILMFFVFSFARQKTAHEKTGG
ncbi:hypothetical protein [Alicyclobacillus cellulosilyticus]|nr:hypothetical protein [Alicyclobacillus cellulosilyticus]